MLSEGVHASISWLEVGVPFCNVTFYCGGLSCFDIMPFLMENSILINGIKQIPKYIRKVMSWG